MLSSSTLTPARPTILVVDNKEEFLSSLSTRLLGAGFGVYTATDGLAALRSVEEKRPDLLVLDLDLPVMSGFRLIQLLRRDEELRQLPVIVMTDYPFQAARDVVSLGVNAFLEKPFEIEHLVQAIHASLGDRLNEHHRRGVGYPVEAVAGGNGHGTCRSGHGPGRLTNRTDVRIMPLYVRVLRMVVVLCYLLPAAPSLLLRWISRTSLSFLPRVRSQKSMPRVG